MPLTDIPTDVQYRFEGLLEGPPLQILKVEGFAQNQANTYTSCGKASSADGLARQAALIQFMGAGAPVESGQA